MSKLKKILWCVIAICFVMGLQPGSTRCWADSVRSYVTTWYHTDYVPGGEPYRDKKEKETDRQEMISIDNTSGSLREGSYESFASAYTRYGINNAHALVKVTNATDEVVVAYAWSEFKDELVFASSAGDEEGELCLGVKIHGTFSGNGNSMSFGIDCWGDGYIDDDFDDLSLYDYEDPYQIVSGCVRYRVGQEFTLMPWLEVQARMGEYEENVTGETEVDFSQTAAITSFTYTPGHTLTTSSGTVYPVDYTPPGVSPSIGATIPLGLDSGDDGDSGGCGCATFGQKSNVAQFGVTGLIYLLPFGYAWILLKRMRRKRH